MLATHIVRGFVMVGIDYLNMAIQTLTEFFGDDAEDAQIKSLLDEYKKAFVLNDEIKKIPILKDIRKRMRTRFIELHKPKSKPDLIHLGSPK